MTATNGQTTAIRPYWLYSRIGAHLGDDDQALMAKLDQWADAHVTNGGSAALTDQHRDLIRAEHEEARVRYSTVGI